MPLHEFVQNILQKGCSGKPWEKHLLDHDAGTQFNATGANAATAKFTGIMNLPSRSDAHKKG